jgi:hypothetical protein
MDIFRQTAKSNYIRLAPVFFSDGRRVKIDQLPIRLENATIEIMFSLRHYYYAVNKNNRADSNTFTATIEQIRILQSNPTTGTPLREPSMKTLQLTPASQKGKGTKRTQLESEQEDSPSKPKKTRQLEGMNLLHIRHLLSNLPKASSSASTLDRPNTPLFLSHEMSEELDETVSENPNDNELNSS